jgi:hypothetical protein
MLGHFTEHGECLLLAFLIHTGTLGHGGLFALAGIGDALLTPRVRCLLGAQPARPRPMHTHTHTHIHTHTHTHTLV